MALWDYVQSAHAEGTNPSVNLTITAGNVIVVGIARVTSPAVADGTNTYTARSTSGDAAIWTAFNVVGGALTIQVTGGVLGSASTITVMELVGDATVAFDTESNQLQFPGTWSNAPSGSISTVNAIEALIGFAACGTGNPGLSLESSGFTNRQSWLDANAARNIMATQVTGSSGSYQYNPTLSPAASSYTRSMIVALKSSGAAAIAGWQGCWPTVMVEG